MKQHHWQLLLTVIPSFFSDVTVNTRSSAALLSSQPQSLFHSTICEKPLTHLMNTCHTLTLRIAAHKARESSPSVTATEKPWQRAASIYIFTQYASGGRAARLRTATPQMSARGVRVPLNPNL